MTRRIEQAEGQWPVIVSGRFETSDDRLFEAHERLNEAVVLRPGVGNSKRFLLLFPGNSIRTSSHIFETSMATKTASGGVSLPKVMVGLSPKRGFDTFTLEICGPALTACLRNQTPDLN